MNEIEEDLKNLQYNESILQIWREFSDEKEMIQRMNDIDLELGKRRTLYKESDKIIKRLKEEKRILFDLMKTRINGFIEAEKRLLNSNIKSTERPKGVESEYINLVNKYSRQASILNNMESNLQSLRLEKAKNKQPWELITNPTINDFPISPKKLRIFFLSLLFGNFIALITSYYFEKKRYNFLTKKK